MALLPEGMVVLGHQIREHTLMYCDQGGYQPAAPTCTSLANGQVSFASCPAACRPLGVDDCTLRRSGGEWLPEAAGAQP
jgi:hypothetical protein